MNPLNRNVGLNRREFFTLLTGASIAFCAGCKSLDNGGGPPAGKTTVIDAGPAANYAAEGVYSTFTEEGFFVIRHQGKLLAISSICTHRCCILDAEPDHSFFCHCHGSTFSPDGKVTEGPATRDLPMLETSLGPNGHLLVRVSAGEAVSHAGESPAGRIRRFTTERDARKEAVRLNLQAGYLLNQQATTKVNSI